MPVHGFVFDLDGTLTLPVLDFTLLRSNLQCPKGTDILEFCNSKSGKDKEIAFKLVEEFEEEGRQKTKLQPGVFELLKFLSQHGLKRALITRNLQPSVDQFLDLMGDPANYGGPFTHVSSILSMQNQPVSPCSLLLGFFAGKRDFTSSVFNFCCWGADLSCETFLTVNSVERWLFLQATPFYQIRNDQTCEQSLFYFLQ